MSEREQKKYERYPLYRDGQRVTDAALVPIILNTYGGVGTKAIEFLYAVAGSKAKEIIDESEDRNSEKFGCELTHDESHRAKDDRRGPGPEGEAQVGEGRFSLRFNSAHGTYIMVARGPQHEIFSSQLSDCCRSQRAALPGPGGPGGPWPPRIPRGARPRAARKKPPPTWYAA